MRGREHSHVGNRRSTQGTEGVDGSYPLISRQRDTSSSQTTFPLNPSNPIKATPWLYSNTEPVKASLTQTTTLWSSLPTEAHGQDSVRVEVLIREQISGWKRF